MELYVGMDLHSRNTYLGNLNEESERILKRELPMIHTMPLGSFTRHSPMTCSTVGFQ